MVIFNVRANDGRERIINEDYKSIRLESTGHKMCSISGTSPLPVDFFVEIYTFPE